LANNWTRETISSNYDNKLYFSDTIEVVGIGAEMPATKPRLLDVYVSTIKIYEQMISNGEYVILCELTDGHKLYGPE
jgi:hypothetical protein